MKKREQIEIKIYETIGIKKFKKIIFKIRDAIYNTFHKKESKEENNKNLYEKQSNYVIGKKMNLENIINYKTKIKFNTTIHLLALIALIEPLIMNLNILNITLLTINMYCIILQRYNTIRINELIIKLEERNKKINQTNKKQEKQLNKEKINIITQEKVKILKLKR